MSFFLYIPISPRESILLRLLPFSFFSYIIFAKKPESMNNVDFREPFTLSI